MSGGGGGGGGTPQLMADGECEGLVTTVENIKKETKREAASINCNRKWAGTLRMFCSITFVLPKFLSTLQSLFMSQTF